MGNIYDKVLQVVEDNNLTAEELLQILTNYHGMRILDDEIIEYFNSEGYYANAN